jgi:predicted amidophosphoribosyltransferase|tara:strand:- start:28 stop:273 length:246 start_codon:yes stop_codon:yes gene_type:complete
MKKVQEGKIIGTRTVLGKEVPVYQPEVFERIYCKNCNAEVDSEELATGNCKDCGKPWKEHFARDVRVNVLKLPDVFGKTKL